ERQVDGIGEPTPVVDFLSEPSLPAGRQRVILRLATIVGLAPFRLDQSLMFEAVQRRIQRPLLDLELVAGNLLDAQQYAVAVKRSEGDRLQDQKVECSLQEF